MLTICRNERLIEFEQGKTSTYPRSCPTCKFGPCTKNVKVEGSAVHLATAVASPGANPVQDYKYAVLFTESIYHEGDERSRTHPGHGYPAYTQNVDAVKKFDSKDALLDWIRTNERSSMSKKFTAIKYQELKISTRIEVDVA